MADPQPRGRPAWLTALARGPDPPRSPEAGVQVVGGPPERLAVAEGRLAGGRAAGLTAEEP